MPPRIRRCWPRACWRRCGAGASRRRWPSCSTWSCAWRRAAGRSAWRAACSSCASSTRRWWRSPRRTTARARGSTPRASCSTSPTARPSATRPRPRPSTPSCATARTTSTTSSRSLAPSDPAHALLLLLLPCKLLLLSASSPGMHACVLLHVQQNSVCTAPRARSSRRSSQAVPISTTCTRTQQVHGGRQSHARSAAAAFGLPVLPSCFVESTAESAGLSPPADPANPTPLRATHALHAGGGSEQANTYRRACVRVRAYVRILAYVP
mmetsp:Transcript_5831/g.18700  ORF Transcript_5831/g.18700 Transcript_5831/m.18700 type:complete len:267 (+) Transcript_5831:445-1245(+)